MNDSIKAKTMALLGMDDEERERISQERLVNLSQGLVNSAAMSFSQIQQQLGEQMSQVQKLLSSVAKEKAELKQIAETNRQILAQMNRSSTVRIGDVMTDSDGRITGATVHTQHGTMQ